MIRIAIVGVLLMIPTVASARAQFEVAASTGMLLGSSASPVVYRATPTARMPGDPGDIITARAAPYRPGMVFGGSIATKFERTFAVGVDFGLQRFGADAPNDGTSSLERSGWSVGPFVRASLPSDTVSPFLAIGLRYFSDTQEWTRPTPIPAISERWRVEHAGWSVPVTVGVDVPLGRYFTVGPTLSMTYASPASGCARVDGDDPRFVESSYCADAEFDKRVISTHGYTLWTLGVAARLISL